ncbi:hypothetical protein [uncultured Amnibacterium sp.]|uniref:hypothetical protein n=1 Tax=uncultured Amnibacterium sp. TaxID=1631851 RepID=UPI0035C978C8
MHRLLRYMWRASSSDWATTVRFGFLMVLAAILVATAVGGTVLVGVVVRSLLLR